jgi:uncharacterized protein
VRIPSRDEIQAVHQRLAPTPAAFEVVYTHCEIVARIAEQFPVPDVDPALVRAGCLLHDVGVYRLAPGEAYIRHGLLGYEALAELGFADPLARFCAHHTGVGLTRDDVLRQDLPLPLDDYVAETAEERLVMYADKFHSKSTPPRFVSAAAYAVAVTRFGEDKAALFKAMVDEYGEPDLGPLTAEYGHRIV